MKKLILILFVFSTLGFGQAPNGTLVLEAMQAAQKNYNSNKEKYLSQNENMKEVISVLREQANPIISASETAGMISSNCVITNMSLDHDLCANAEKKAAFVKKSASLSGQGVEFGIKASLAETQEKRRAIQAGESTEDLTNYSYEAQQKSSSQASGLALMKAGIYGNGATEIKKIIEQWGNLVHSPQSVCIKESLKVELMLSSNGRKEKFPVDVLCEDIIAMINNNQREVFPNTMNIYGVGGLQAAQASAQELEGLASQQKALSIQHGSNAAISLYSQRLYNQRTTDEESVIDPCLADPSAEGCTEEVAQIGEAVQRVQSEYAYNGASGVDLDDFSTYEEELVGDTSGVDARVVNTGESFEPLANIKKVKYRTAAAGGGGSGGGGARASGGNASNQGRKSKATQKKKAIAVNKISSYRSKKKKRSRGGVQNFAGAKTKTIDFSKLKPNKLLSGIFNKGKKSKKAISRGLANDGVLKKRDVSLFSRISKVHKRKVYKKELSLIYKN